jgi:hypothetical protein
MYRYVYKVNVPLDFEFELRLLTYDVNSLELDK